MARGRGRKERSEAGGSVKLDFASPMYNEWTFTIEDEDYTIEQGGSEVPADKVEALQAEAAKHGIELVQKG